MLVAHGMLVRRSGVSLLARRRGDLAAESQEPEEEEADAVGAFARLCPLRLGLMAVGHTNLVRLVRISHGPSHGAEAYRARPIRTR